MEMSRFLRTVGVALAPKGGDAAALQAAVLEMAKTEGGRKQLTTRSSPTSCATRSGFMSIRCTVRLDLRSNVAEPRNDIVEK